MSNRVTASIHLPAPPERVWEVVMDPNRLGDWVTIHRRLGRVDPGRPHNGYEMEQHLHMRGVRLTVHWTLTQCRAHELAVWEGRGPARSHAHTEYRLRPEGEGTRFDYENEFHPPLGPLGAMASRALVGGIPLREANRSLERLRALFGEDG
jgi:uncharacterized protein YndB with AHSA1/START domain